jgi:hypothetical protein
MERKKSKPPRPLRILANLFNKGKREKKGDKSKEELPATAADTVRDRNDNGKRKKNDDTFIIN